MTNADEPRVKVEFKMADMRFAGEGPQGWIDQQIDKFLDALGVVQGRPPLDASESSFTDSASEPHTRKATSKPLHSYLKETGCDKVQVKRFLGTAAWLAKKGEQKLSTRLVVDTLKTQHQSKLGNPSDCLLKNLRYGFCERGTEKSSFFITPEGWKQVGDSH